MFMFCIVWSLGASLQLDSRPKFEEVLRRVSCRGGLPATSLFDNFYDFHEDKRWVSWDKKVPEYVHPTDGKFVKILVPTVDTVRYSYLLG